MVLTAVTWTEGINTLGFNMTFRQALIVDQTIFEDDNRIDTGKTDRDNNNTLTDESLPNVNVPDKTSFAREIVDWDVIEAQIVASLHMSGAIPDKFYNAIISASPPTEDIIDKETSVKGVTLADVTKARVIFQQSKSYLREDNPFGLGKQRVGSYFKRITEEKQLWRFMLGPSNYYFSPETIYFKNAGRFIKKLDEYLRQLSSPYEMYQFAQSGEQDVLATIGNENFIFQVRNNNVNGSYGITILKGQTSAAENPVSVGGISDIRGAISTYVQAANSNALLRTGSGQYIHLLKLKERTVGLEYFALVISPPNTSPDSFVENIIKIVKEFTGGER